MPDRTGVQWLARFPGWGKYLQGPPPPLQARTPTWKLRFISRKLLLNSCKTTAVARLIHELMTYGLCQPRSGATLVVKLFAGNPKPQRGDTWQGQ